jgi:uncharacterized protein YjiS (DUF1127 family)
LPAIEQRAALQQPRFRTKIMVAIDTTNSAAPRIAGRLIASLFNLGSVFKDWNDARVTRNALSRLSSRELDDIGLCYGDIEDIATRSYR